MLFCLLLLIPHCLAESPLVETPYGKVRGFSHTTPLGNEVNVYLGIPYAQAPEGDLRFEKPVMIEKWDTVLELATAFGHACHVFYRTSIISSRNYSENCLTVGVVTPAEKSANLPVLAYIHGGGFAVGDAEMGGYKRIAEHFVSKGIVFVTIQYRLGFLGFLSSEDGSIPGNLGLWDQTLALEFIREVIPSFGGDPNRITLMGQSAGSACVSALLTSPHSNKLFNQAIELSGSVLGLGYGDRVKTVTSKLALAINCDEKENTSLKDCLKSKSIEDFYNAMDIAGGGINHPQFIIFHPVPDKDFFPEPLDQLIAKAPKKRTIQGVTDDEAAIFTYQINIKGVSYLYLPEEKRKDYGYKDLERFVDDFTTKEEFGAEASSLKTAIMGFYSNRSDDTPYFYTQAFTDLISDNVFTLPAYREIELKSESGWETFAYVMDNPRSKESNPILRGTLHGEDLPIVMEHFGLENLPLSERDKAFQNAVISTFAAFIKTGYAFTLLFHRFSSPSTATIKWEPATKKNFEKHIVLAAHPKMADTLYRKEAYKLWFETIPSIVDPKILKKLLLPGVQLSDPKVEL